MATCLERLLDGCDLRLPVHEERLRVHLLAHGEPDLRLYLLDRRRLVASLLGRYVVRPPHPRQVLGVSAIMFVGIQTETSGWPGVLIAKLGGTSW